MSIRLSQISTATFMAAAIVLCPAASAIPKPSAQTDQSAAQKGTPSQVPVMEADPSVALMEKGFQHLYELNFDDARVEFLAYQKNLPDDPMGKAAEAASYLFEQFNAKGILTSDFFLNDAKFLGGVDVLGS
jgi:TolA-binding protein